MATTFNDPLVDAADIGDVEQVTKLIKQGIQPDSKGDFATTALMRAAFRGNTDIIQILLESGAYINAADVGGETALHLAAKNGHVDAVKSLIYYGAFVDIPDKEQWTPLMRATLAKQPDVVKALLDKGADITAVNSIRESVLVHAAIAGVPDIAAMILGNPKAKNISKDQETMAIGMAKRKKHDNVEKVISSFVETQNKSPELASYESKFSSPKNSDEEKTLIVKPAPPIPDIPQINTATKTPDSLEKLIAETSSKTHSEKTTNEAPDSFKAPIAKEITYESAGIFFVQLGNFNDTSSAEAAWDKALSTNKDLLGKLSPKIVKTTIGSRVNDIVYRLRAGTFSTRSAADAACKSIRERQSECFVVEITNTPPEKDTVKTANADESKQTKYTPDYLSPVTPPVASTAAKTLSSSASMPASAFAGSYPKLADGALPPTPTAESAAPSSPIDIDPATQAASTPIPTTRTNQISPIPEQANNNNIDNSALTAKAYPPLAGPQSIPTPKSIDALTPNQSRMPENNDAFAASKEQARNEVQEMTRENFFRKQGITPPARQKKEYDDFYKQMENNKKDAPVSEAVLVPDETYFSGSRQASQSSGGSWINISNLPSEEFANDYGQRMFKNDQSLGNVQVVVVKPVSAPGGKATVSMRVGPLLSNQTDALCNAVIAGGFGCSATGGSASQANSESGYSPSMNTAKRAPSDMGDNPFSSTQQPDNSTDFWISLGTFASNSEAEYYWMFIKEDNGDILNSLKYNLGKATGVSDFSDGAVQLRTGPFSAKQRAAQLCNIMRYRNIACLVSE